MFAHYRPETGESQSLEDHLFLVAEKARSEADAIDQGDALFLIGLFHDLGKADRNFQEKLTRKPNLHVDHSYAGAKYLFAKIRLVLKRQNISKKEFNLFNEIVAYVISAHHGMYDIRFDADNSAFFQFNKLAKRCFGFEEGYHYQPDVEDFASILEKQLPQYGYESLDHLITLAFENFSSIWTKVSYNDDGEKDFYNACVVRLYLSLLKNADILDTINAYETLLTPPNPDETKHLAKAYLKSVEELYAGFVDPKTPINRIRNQVATRVQERGTTDGPGIYRLNLPTGAGKTNLSLRYASHQMVLQQKQRFFYVTPYLSVLEQNAQAMKKVIGESGVLEHHSNVVKDKSDQGEEVGEQEELLSAYLLDSWDSPVVLTTMVQFFQTLFKTKSANIRRFSSLIDSIVILDEVQSLPIEVTTLFNLTMNFLSRVMGATIVLCTATQPIYDSKSIAHPIQYGGKNGEKPDIVELSANEQVVFQRTELFKFDEQDEKTSLADLADSILKQNQSTLIVLNTKKSVGRLYQLLEGQTDRPLYYLSTNMCPQHRLNVIAEVKEGLEAGLPLICVSTQLIEAGVDLDFEQVVRSYAGLDSIVQASGRCNREGKREKGRVTLVNVSKEEENLSRLKAIRDKKKVTEDILHGLSSPIDVSRLNATYFEKYFANEDARTLSYPVGDNDTVYDYLSSNPYSGSKKGALRQSFKTAGQKMDLIDDESLGVFVFHKDWEEALLNLEDRLAALPTFPELEDLRDIKEDLKKLQLFTVNLRETDELLKATRSYLNGQVLFLQEEYYDGVIGVKKEADSFIF
ncbi:CRISPR-associated helicase Cas3' [Streptococcus merionis]|uniref:CRISPR-associated helicase Cas3' n=1 Tax=Streptococcus merionis TaxID=400065 RepID=UPI0035199CF8